MNIFFKNIHLINPPYCVNDIVDLHIVDGKIVFFGNVDDYNLSVESEIIDGTDLVATPGFIDIHTHFREPGQTHKETLSTGAAAAANGGFTEVVVMPNTSPAIDNCIIVEYINSKSKHFLTKIHISAAITQGCQGEIISNMHSLAEAGVVYFTDDGNCVSSAITMKMAFEYATQNDYLLAQHCEEHSLTRNFSMNESDISMKLGLQGYPNIAEEIVIDRDIRLAAYCKDSKGLPRRYHVQHLSSAKSVEIIRNAKSNGGRISCEVTPHHLWFTDDRLLDYDTNFKMNPPLRKQEDIDSLISGLKDGTIDCIASDHAPHSSEECEVEFERAPNGIIGLETALGAVFTKLYHGHKFSIEEIVNLMSVNPRRILGLPQVEINVGSNANLTILNPNEKWVVDSDKFMSKARNTPFNAITLIGKPVYTINNGKIVKCKL